MFLSPPITLAVHSFRSPRSGEGGAWSDQGANALALLSHAHDLVESIQRERQLVSVGWKWLCFATVLKASMDAFNRARRAPNMQSIVYDKWIRLCAARPDPSIYWEFINVERDRVLMLDEPPLLRNGSRGVKGRWRINGSTFDGCDARSISEQALHWLGQYMQDAVGAEAFAGPGRRFKAFETEGGDDQRGTTRSAARGEVTNG